MSLFGSHNRDNEMSRGRKTVLKCAKDLLNLCTDTVTVSAENKSNGLFYLDVFICLSSIISLLELSLKNLKTPTTTIFIFPLIVFYDAVNYQWLWLFYILFGIITSTASFPLNILYYTIMFRSFYFVYKDYGRITIIIIKKKKKINRCYCKSSHRLSIITFFCPPVDIGARMRKTHSAQLPGFCYANFWLAHFQCGGLVSASMVLGRSV